MLRLNFTGSSDLANRHNATFHGHTNVKCICNSFSNSSNQ